MFWLAANRSSENTTAQQPQLHGDLHTGATGTGIPPLIAGNDSSLMRHRGGSYILFNLTHR